MVNARKELFDVALQDPARSRIIPAHGSGEFSKPIQSPVGPLADPARVRVGNKCIELSRHLDEIGRMLGGWARGLVKRNPASGGE